MLKDAHTGRMTRANIHAGGVEKFRKAVGRDTADAISSWIFEQFDASQSGWVNTSWTAPKTWEGTPLDAIWQYFSPISDEHERHEQSALLYGCIFYTTLF
jgi:hypothetical protein